MIAYAEGLVADSKQAPMLHGLTEAMLKSPFSGEYTCTIYTEMCVCVGGYTVCVCVRVHSCYVTSVSENLATKSS